MIAPVDGLKKRGRPPGRPANTAKFEPEPRVPVRAGLAQCFNLTTGGLRSGKERRASGKKAEKQ